MRIANNLSALGAFNALNSTNKSLQKTINSLSSGLRINSASDDAAGFAVSEKMRSQIRGLDVALRNSQDGISLLQTAEGALGQTNDMLQRMRDLSIQASNDSLMSNDRQYIQLEIDELKKQIDQIAGTTQFNKKRILDGSSGALWSSSDSGVKVRVNGGLTRTDNFGQKVSAEGNYKIEIKAKPGEAQVQKSGIFTIKKIEPVRDASTYDCEININTGMDTSTGLASGTNWKFEGGVLTITGDGNFSIVGDTTSTANRIVVPEGINAKVKLRDVNIESATGSAFQITGSNVRVFLEGENTLSGGGPEQAGLEVRNAKDDGPKGSVEINSVGGLGSEEGILNAHGSGCGAGIGGSCHTPLENVGYSVGKITINGGTINATAAGGAAIGGGGHFSDHPSEEPGAHVQITINGGNISAVSGGGAGIGCGVACLYDSSNVDYITINGGTIKARGGAGSAAIGGGAGGNSGVIRINRAAELTLQGWIDTENGRSQPIGRGRNGALTGRLYNDVEFHGNSRYCIEEIPEFYDSQGVFMVTQPQKITVIQGDGKTAEVMLYAKDTIYDVRDKLNDAIASGLGQAAYTSNGGSFVSFVESGKESEAGYETVAGTFVIRSAVPGRDGEIVFSSDNQDLLNAFGLNTIQESSESKFTASVYDAHSGAKVNTMTAESGEFKSIIPPEIDIDIDPMTTAISANWDESTKRFIFGGNDDYMTMLHLKDNGITFHTGANMGEDFSIQLGDMSCSALGISRVNLATRESASRSIGIIDRAITRVSSQRAKIGAYINGLEHTMTNLTTTTANLTEAESRIRDTDMAQTMMDFVKLQILNQSGTSMLAQANQIPQSVMSLFN